jgi:hypothetical protein
MAIAGAAKEAVSTRRSRPLSPNARLQRGASRCPMVLKKLVLPPRHSAVWRKLFSSPYEAE